MARTSATRLTAPGRGAVATIAVRGDSGRLVELAGFRPATGGRLAGRSTDRIVYGHWGTEPAEDVVVCRTFETETEIHCHGGDAATARILNDLHAVGVTGATWNETRSTFETELATTVMRATTVRTATLALAQSNGVLRAAIESLLAETDAEALVTGLDELLRWADVGLHLATPWRVVLTGRPNVGKSSLVNALLGFTRSIVYDQPGTTRDVVTGETALDGWPVTLADTAGLRTGADALESRGIDRARASLRTADLVIALDDASVPRRESTDETWPNVLRVAHKSDLPPAWTSHEHRPVSSVTGAGVDDLIAAIAARLVPNVPTMQTALPVTARQIARLDDALRFAGAKDVMGAHRSLHSLLVAD